VGRRERAAFAENRSFFSSRVIHLSQSFYARSFLRDALEIDALMVSDYIRLDGFGGNRPPSDRGQSIAFNPLRGASRLKQAIRAFPQYRWTPIRDMSRTQVLDTLGSSCVYLDLGHHPGRDRMPREAALQGAVVVSSVMGSGGYPGDMDIPDDFKIDLNLGRRQYLCQTGRSLEMVFSDPDRASAMQAAYRQKIRTAQRTFSEEVRVAFAGEGRQPDSIGRRQERDS
jgi:hypothetical protein